MKAEIEVLQPGLFSTIQDLGRFGFLKFGVPQSGVMDRYAMRICNLILGNPENASVLEITMQGPQLKFNATTAICISGANFSPQVNGNKIAQNELVVIHEGDILKFGTPQAGFRSYLGIKGGFHSEYLMDSYSWYEGLTEHFRLKKGLILGYSSNEHKNRHVNATLKINTAYLNETSIEVYPGPEFENLKTTQQNQILNSVFTPDENSNRMAVQLKEELKNDLQPIVTSPVMPGTVQLTPSGKMIILMRDCQTTGGYPRILQLSEKGIQVLSQKLPGTEISFKKKEYPSI